MCVGTVYKKQRHITRVGFEPTTFASRAVSKVIYCLLPLNCVQIVTEVRQRSFVTFFVPTYNRVTSKCSSTKQKIPFNV